MSIVKIAFIVGLLNTFALNQACQTFTNTGLLSLHKMVRNDLPSPAADMQNLEWDKTLETKACSVCEKCQPETMATDQGNYGANYAEIEKEKSSPIAPLNLAVRWVGQKENFDVDRGCINGKPCKAYSQMIYAKANQVGCSLCNCPSMKVNTVKRYLVCMYSAKHELGTKVYTKKESKPLDSMGPVANNPINREQIIKLHNELRRSVDPPASDMNALTWSNNLEHAAYNFSLSCPNGHSGNDLGENLAWNFYPSGMVVLMTSAMSTWVEEKTYFKHSAGCLNGEQCNHYRQMINAKTSRVGCAIHACPLNYPNYHKQVVVCNYYPPLMEGSNVYTVGTSCCKNRYICKNEVQC